VGGRQAEAGLRALRTGGRYLVLGFASGTIPYLPLNQVLLRNRAVIGVDWGAWAAAEPLANRQLVDELFDLSSRDRIHPAEPSARPLEEAGAVLAALLKRSGTGKTVLVP
jgi:NADPH2:quinone reductase